MAEKLTTIILTHHSRGCSYDVKVSLDISAQDLIIGLNEGYKLGLNVNDPAGCYLSAEKPVMLLRGNKQLADFGVREGTTIHIGR